MAKKIAPATDNLRRKPASQRKQAAERRSPATRLPSKFKVRPSGAQKTAAPPESDLFRILMENTTDRIYFKDSGSRFILINRSVADEMGLSDPSAAVGKTDFDFFSEEHARQAYNDEQQIIAGGQPKVGIEEKETWPDGHETWVSTTKLPIRDRKGRIIGTFGISRDITEYKKGEAARIAATVLRESNIALEKTNAALQEEIAERRRAEEELAFERSLFRTMMDNTSDRFYFKDAESRFLRINRAQAAAFGLSDPTEAIGKTDFDFFSEEHARQAYNDEQQIIAGGQPKAGIEEKETWPDGHETWVSTTKLPIRDQKGLIIGTYGISRDISERKAIELSILQTNRALEKTNAALQEEIAERRRAEAVLDRERNLLHGLIDNLPEFIYAKDAEGRFTLANEALARHMGANKPEDLYGKNDFDFYPPDLATKFQADEQALLQSGQRIIEHEEANRGADGRPILTLTTKVLLYDSQGKIIGLVGNSQDITERKAMELSIRHANEELEKTNAALHEEIAERLRAETALGYERNLFRTMMDNTSDRIYFKDAESHFLLINKAQAAMFGLDDPSKAVGKTDFDFFTDEHARQAFSDEQEIIRNEKPLVGVEEKETWPDGHETWVSSTKIPMRDQAGRIIGTFGISRDITERRAMEFAIQTANDQLAVMVNWLEGRNREISVLNEMGKLLEACRSSEEAYPVISIQMEKLIPVHAGRLFLLNKGTGLFDVAASWGNDTSRTESFPPQDCRGIQSGSIYFANAADSGLYCPHLRLGPGEQPACLCIPLKAQGETIGVLHLRNHQERGSPDTLLDAKQELANTAADYIALSLANLSLRETLRIQSIRDALTGLYNRRYLEESLPRELSRSKRKGTTLGVVMLDLDRLKQVNDVFGHDAGDIFLAELGHWLQSHVRAEDISCRYGGDEFVLILPDASLESTYQRARQICEGVRSLQINDNDRSLGSMTVSIGVAGFPENGESRDELLAAADAALYKAKERGRNCVVDAGEKFSTV